MDIVTANDMYTSRIIANLPKTTKLMSIREYPTEMLIDELARRDEMQSNALRKIYDALGEMR